MSNSFHLGFVVSNKRCCLECQCSLGSEGITGNLHSICIDDCSQEYHGELMSCILSLPTGDQWNVIQE